MLDERGGFSAGANGEVTRREILRALAWAAPLTATHLRRLVAPAMTDGHFRERMLAPLMRDELIRGEYHYTGGAGHTRPEKRRPPKRHGRAWALSPAGFAQIAGDDKAPGSPARMRGGAVLGHDLMLGEVVTCIIEWTRPILSSIYLEHEDRLDEARRRPIADALVVVRYDPARVLPGIVPWKSLPPAPGEGVRFYAIEIDRGTEEYGITDAKAINYAGVRADPTYYERYGILYPLILVTVPTEARKRRWHAGWQATWPEGKWMIATEAEVALNSWLEYAGGRERTRSFVDDWTPGADQVATASQTPSGGSLHNESSRRDALPSAAKWFIE